MFGTNLLERRSKPERVADQAWAQLTAAVGSAGDSVRHAARDGAQIARRPTVGVAGDRLGAVADEARARAVRAYDALAGRRPGVPWAWLAGVGLAGVVLGWTAGMATRAAADRAAATRAEEEPPATERVEFVDVDVDRSGAVVHG